MSTASPRQHTLDKLHVINDDGSRRTVFPADVSGRFSRVKPWVFGGLMVVYAGLPWLSVGGRPAVWFDIPRRRAFLFGEVFNAQDFSLVFGLVAGVGFLLIVLSALFGRVWCGWACPQTVFLEGLFRPIERIIEGPATARAALARAPWSLGKLRKRALKHGLYLLVAWTIAHLFLAYFVSVEELGAMIVGGPVAHPAAFAWGLVPTLLLYFNFWWFREQLCLIVCPYGRLQSALQDKDTLIIGYDARRGEPRGKAKDPSAGDCVDCGRCIAVCPTDIDIRNGLQMECIGCAACVDACDDIMTKLGRPTGLIRYDSQRGLDEGVRRFWRPRVAGYAALGGLGLVAVVLLFSGRSSFEANVLRPPGTTYLVSDGVVRNQLTVHVVNKNPGPSTLSVSVSAPEGVDVTLPQPSISLGSLEDYSLPVLLSLPQERFRFGLEVQVTVRDEASEEARTMTAPVLGSRGVARGQP